MMFASLEVIGGSFALWFYAGLNSSGDFTAAALKGLLIASLVVGIAKLVLMVIMRHFRALYFLLALVISAGWAWVGFKLAPMMFDDPNAPLYGAGLLGVFSMLEKLLQPQVYFEDHEGRFGQAVGEGLEKLARAFTGKD